MAQSPLEAKGLSASDAYLSNWNTLSGLLTSGRSFSGRERHCAFLNLPGQGRFADVSAASGLDFIDDGRGMAVTDWDGDGDLDLWITQRNGPRVRFIRNDAVEMPRSMAFSLEGVTVNRDAIGARVALETSADRRLHRTVRAGDSFLSQSSKVVLFGLLAGEWVKSVEVSWPGAGKKVESFALPEPDEADGASRRFRLKEGAGVAVARDRTVGGSVGAAALAPSVPQAAPFESNRRLVLIRRPEAPTFDYVDFQGEIASFPRKSDSHQGPMLINLWASWCSPCVQELGAMAKAWKALQEKNLGVLALSTDAVTEDGSKPDLSRVKNLVARQQYPFAMGVIDVQLIQRLTNIHHRAIGTQKPLVMPTSFLVDRQGKVAVIYLGPVEVDQLLKDVELLEAAPKVIEAASFPFPGANGIELFTLTPMAFAQAYQKGGYVDDAREAIVGELDSGASAFKAHYFLGALEQSQSNWSAAAQAYQKVLELAPNQVTIHVPLAVALWQANKKDEAVRHFKIAETHAVQRVSIWSDLGRAHLQIGEAAKAVTYFEKTGRRDHLAGALIAAGRFREGVAIYESILGDNPENHQVSNRLAWALATHDGATAQDRERALELAQKLAALSASGDPRVLDTLAAAKAQAGDFEAARRHVIRARELARGTGETKLAGELSRRLETYSAGRPWRD